MNIRNVSNRFERILTSDKTILLGLFSLFILFHKVFEEIITNVFVTKFLARIDQVWYSDVVFYALLLFIFLRTISRFRNYTPPSSLTMYLITISVIYSYYRFLGNVWEFVPLKSIGALCYSDLVLFISLSNAFLLYSPQKSLSLNSADSFLEDQPLGAERPDELGYNVYASTLARKILRSHFQNAFAIGITGKWGLGKTSFLDLIKRNLRNDEVILVDFKPWNNKNSSAVIQDFFESIKFAVRPYDSSLSSLLVKYSNKLTTLNDNTFTQSVKTMINFFSGLESTDNLYTEINNALIQNGKKIIIFIDDLDRLDKEEIIEVIRLMRSTANFYNTFFLVAYDKSYIAKALKEHNSYSHERFLEKIFQIEVTLPFFNKDELRYKLAQRLTDALPQSYHNSIEQVIMRNESMKASPLNEWLETMRDVTRLTNSLCANIEKLTGEVDFYDFLRLELLRLKYGPVHELLFRNTPDFLQVSKGSYEEYRYHLKIHGSFGRTELNTTSSSALESYLIAKADDLLVERNEISKIMTLVNDVFPNSKTWGISNLSVVYPSKFGRYFAYDLLKGDLSEIDFSKGRASPQDDFNILIGQWVDDGIESDLCERLRQIKTFDGREDYEKIITALFYLANIKGARYIYRYKNDLVDKLNNYEDSIVNKFYPTEHGKEQYRAFIRGFFERAQSPYFFESEVATEITNHFMEDFGLDKSEFESILISYFRKYCEANRKLDTNVWGLYRNCKRTNREDLGNNHYKRHAETFPEANQIFKELIDSDFDNFLLAMIRSEKKSDLFEISNFVSILYGSWSDFERLLDSKKENEWKYLSEFKQIFDKFKEVEFSKRVEFKFNVIPIHLKEQ